MLDHRRAVGNVEGLVPERQCETIASDKGYARAFAAQEGRVVQPDRRDPAGMRVPGFKIIRIFESSVRSDADIDDGRLRPYVQKLDESSIHNASLTRDDADLYTLGVEYGIL